MTKTAMTIVTSKDCAEPIHSVSDCVSCVSATGDAAMISAVVSAMSGIHSGALRQVVEYLAGCLLFGILLGRSFGTADQFWSVAVKRTQMSFDRELFLMFRSLFPDQHI